VLVECDVKYYSLTRPVGLVVVVVVVVIVVVLVVEVAAVVAAVGAVAADEVQLSKKKHTQKLI